jgi:hypothetical protein
MNYSNENQNENNKMKLKNKIIYPIQLIESDKQMLFELNTQLKHKSNNDIIEEGLKQFHNLILNNFKCYTFIQSIDVLKSICSLVNCDQLRIRLKSIQCIKYLFQKLKNENKEIEFDYFRLKYCIQMILKHFLNVIENCDEQLQNEITFTIEIILSNLEKEENYYESREEIFLFESKSELLFEKLNQLNFLQLNKYRIFCSICFHCTKSLLKQLSLNLYEKFIEPIIFDSKFYICHHSIHSKLVQLLEIINFKKFEVSFSINLFQFFFNSFYSLIFNKFKDISIFN